ncbi:choline/ethanolamine kinase isoform X1 [Homalodisca vitripennis]|uniref:choline/ethanolamine kinase isoform X1 n=2 Tax=Homalodisca vitripennis TaxID=197043 RepID=UPI001EEC3F9B|nr:choline/ethanolamine kinase isoform X1 [Homalodisca vitripennis]
MVLKNKMHGENGEMLDLALRVCRGYLNGPWKKISPNDISVKRISGGLSNWLYQVSLTKPLAKPAEPAQVLLRLYGQTHGERALESLITDSVIFTLLSERGLGPRLHGIFPGGRIEEYIPARPLKTRELADERLSPLIATRLAAVHSMHVPINKEPRWLWDTTARWLQTIDEAKLKENHVVDENPIAETLYKLDLQKEVTWLREYLIKIKSQVVFCHNDLQEGNILLREDQEEPSLVLIDFEYCSYNYRGFDLANHFIEWTYDYTKPDYPNFSVHKEYYPSEEQMRVFLERYAHSVPGQSPPCIEMLIREVHQFTLASHLFWGLWGVVNAKRSQIPFGYWEYAKERIDSYFQLKSELVGFDTGIKRKAADLE